MATYLKTRSPEAGGDAADAQVRATVEDIIADVWENNLSIDK